MFFFENIINTIKRNKAKSLIGLFVSAVMLLLVNIYIGNIYSVRAQLHELPKVMPVYCYISNLNGTQWTGLSIKEDIYHNLSQSASVKNLNGRLTLIGNVKDSDQVNKKDNIDLTITAVNSILAYQKLSENSLFLVNTKKSDLYKDNIISCIVKEELMNEWDWKIGQVISLDLYYYKHEPYNKVTINPLDIQEYQIVGSIKGSEIAGVEEAQIIVPLRSLQEVFGRNKLPFYVDALSFYVTDPLKLNEFKEEMDTYSLLPVMPKTDFATDGNALNVKDSVFIAAATTLRQQADLQLDFLPMVCAMVLLVGYISSSLLMQGRRSEFRLMRMIGIGKGKAIITFFIEQCLLVVGGAIIGIVVTQIFQEFRIEVLLTSGGLCLSYCIGCLLALIGISRRSIMENRI